MQRAFGAGVLVAGEISGRGRRLHRAVVVVEVLRVKVVGVVVDSDYRITAALFGRCSATSRWCRLVVVVLAIAR